MLCDPKEKDCAGQAIRIFYALAKIVERLHEVSCSFCDINVWNIKRFVANLLHNLFIYFGEIS